jgi:hypothetical protein
MTTPLHVNPADLHAAGGRWQQWSGQLADTPPSGGQGDWPSSAGAAGFTKTAGHATTQLQGNVSATGKAAQTGGDSYQDAEKENREALKDQMGMLRDIMGTGTNLLQSLGSTASGTLGPFVSGLSAALSGGASAGSSLVSALGKAVPGNGAAKPLPGTPIDAGPDAGPDHKGSGVPAQPWIGDNPAELGG